MLFFLLHYNPNRLQAVIAGWVSTDGLAAHIAGVNVVSIVYMIPLGISQSLSTLIGGSLGEGMPKLAVEFARKGSLLMLVVSCMYGVGILLNVDRISRLYSTEPEMLSVLSIVLQMMSGFVVIDAMNAAFAGIIRGLGLQSRAARYQAFGSFCVMLPIGYITYPFLGIPGIWTGSIAGLFVSASLFFSIIYKADFNECSRRAIHEARTHHQQSSV